MNIEKCVDILNARASQSQDASGGCPCHTSLASLCIGSTAEEYGSAALGTEGGLLSGMNTINLMNLFTALQGERVQAHVDYNQALDLLCKEDRLGEYPILCAEATSRFAVISKKIIAIKDIMIARGASEAATAIANIQSLEKGKLTLVAAQHLDKIHEKLPSVAPVMHDNMTLTPSAANKQYTTDKIAEIECTVSNILEDFQAMKCDIDDDV
jgi:hypothetical protein